MASISSLGAGTSLDSESIVTQLVAAERKVADLRLNGIEKTTSSKISAYGHVRAALSGLQDTLTKLLGTGSALGRLTTPAAGAGFTATATAAAALGKYEVTVESLATNHKLQTAQIASATQLGYGDLSIQVGTDAPINVSIANGKGTLTEIRDAINAAAGGKGVTASVVRGDSGDVLMLTSAKTGSAGRMTVTASGGDGGLNALNTTGGTWNVVSAGTDASVVVDGVRKTSSSNTVDMVDGLTLSLTKADPGTSFTVDVSADTSPLKASLLSFISAYNTALNQLATQSKASGTPGASGPLSGDAVLRGISSTMRNSITANYAKLSELGLKTALDGTLSLDGTKFDAAIAANPDAVKGLLGTDGTLGASMRTSVSNYIGIDGLVTTKTKSLTKRMDDLQDQRDALDLKMEKVESRYRKQFAALSAILSKMDGLSSYISQQLNNNNNNKKNS